MNQYDHVVHLVENLFGIAVDRNSIATIQRPYDSHLLTLKFSTEGNSIATIQRPYDSHLLTLKFSTEDNETYLLKEFQSHPPSHLETIFSELEQIRDRKPHLSFPLLNRSGNYHFADQSGRNFQLLKFLNISHFDEKKTSLKLLFNEIEELHQNLSQCSIPPNQYTNLQAYFVVGVRRIQERYGADLPFLPKLESFIKQLSIASIRQGVRHGDIQETNVYLLGDEIIFIDCDIMHFGYPLMDYIQGAAMYLDQEKLDSPENQAIVKELWQQAKAEAPDLTKKDMRYLLARVILGPIQGGEVQPGKDVLKRFLLDLQGFCEAEA